LLFVRIGPLCDVAAAAVPVVGAEMATGDCHGAPSTPKHSTASSCATGCIAIPAKMPAVSLSQNDDPIEIAAALARSLTGLSGGPAPPPPRP